jgi:site-specific recombinase XerD
MSTTPSASLDQMVQAYLDDLQVRGYKPKTINGYAKNLHTFVAWAKTQAAGTLAQFTPDLVKAYIRYLQHKPKWAEKAHRQTTQDLVAASAIRNYVRDLKTFASWLAQEHYTPEHRLAAIKLPKVDETPIEPFTDADLDVIFRSLNPTDPCDLRDYVVLHTLWDTGMRVRELVALTLDDVDLKTRQMRIQHAKFGKWRDIGFGKETQKYLTRYFTLSRPEPAIAGDRHLFLSLDGYPLTEGAVQKMCRRYTKRTGIHIHPHRFRHTFAVQMLRAGTDLRTLQRLMGHSDIRILSRYLNLASDDAIRAHQTNSPADRHQQQRRTNGQRLPVRRGPLGAR